MIKLVIFDLDDTLIPEIGYVESGLKVVSKFFEEKYNLKNSYEELIEMRKESNNFLFNRYLDKKKIEYDEADIQKIVEIYRNHEPEISFYDDVIPTINKLKEKNIKTAIISDGNSKTQKKKANVLNLEQYMDYILFTDDLGKQFWKPNPRAFEILKTKFDIKYDEMIYVGDNPKKDFYISKIHPVHTVRIYRSEGIYFYEEYLEGVKEKYKIAKLDKLIQIIDDINY